MVITKGGRSGEAGGKIYKMGLSFNKDLTRSEGVGAAYRTLIELGLIEALGKFTRVPYWKCLDIDSTNPDLMDQVREWYDAAPDKERILFVQRKLAGMNRYKGPLDGVTSAALTTAISEYQAYVGLIADGRINFDLYFSLKDDTQNQLAVLPVTPPSKISAPPTTQNPQGSHAPISTSAMPFRVNLTSDRGGNPTYKVGEALNMKLSLNSPGMAYCYYEDVNKNTARIFPNQFYGNPMLAGNLQIPLPTGGFKIKFDRPGRERVMCIGSDRELLIPPVLAGSKDLAPLAIHPLEKILDQFKTINPLLTTSTVEITVQ